MARKLRYNDEEGGMIKAQLMKIESYAAKLNEMIHPDDEIEGWVQAKLAVVAAYMGDVKHYLDYELKQAFGEGGGVGSKPRYWEVEFTWEGEEEGDGRKVNVMADSVTEAEQKVKEKFGMYYKGLKVVEVEEDKEMTWDEYAKRPKKYETRSYSKEEMDEITRAQIKHDKEQLRREQGFSDGGMMAKGGETHFNLSVDERMEIKNLKGLIEESIEAIESHEKLAEKSDDKETKSYHKNKVKKNKEVLANRKSRLEKLTKRKMAEGGEVMVELVKRGHNKDRAEKLVKKHSYLIDVANDTEEAADDIEKYDTTNEFPEVPQLKFAHGGDVDEDEVDVEEQREKVERMYEADREEAAIRQLENRSVKLSDLMHYDDLYYVGNIFDTDSDGWVSKFEAEKIIDEINTNRYDEGGEIKKVFVEITKPSEISLNRVKRQVEQFAQAGYRSADILLKMAFVTDRPKLLEDQFQKLKNSVYYFRDVKKYYRGGKMEDEFLRYEGSSFFEDYQEAKDYLGESSWKDMSYDERVEATKYLKATGKIGYFGEYEDLETVAATMYKKGGDVGKFLVVVKKRKTNTTNKLFVNSLSDIDKRQYEVLSVKKLG